MRRTRTGGRLEALLGSLLIVVLLAACDPQADAAPPDQTQAVQPVTALVERRTLRESLPLRGTVHRSLRGTLRTATTGQITRLLLRQGEVVQAGAELLRVDGRPVVAVPGAMPYWRNLSAGARGDDVRQLQEMLAAEGYEVGSVDAAFGRNTTRALRQWQAAHLLPVTGELAPGDIVTGQWPARLGTVSAALGDRLAPGDELAQLVADELAVTLTLSPTDRLKVHEGQPLTVTLRATGQEADGRVGRVSSVADEAEDGSLTYAADVALDSPLDAVEGAEVVAQVELAEARDVLAVPLAALGMGGSGEPIVQVVGSDSVIEQLQVEPGLAEGAYIEIRSGLSEGQSVVLGGR